VSDAKQFTGVSQKTPYNTQKAVKLKPPLPLTAKNANGTVAQIYAEVRKRWA
jgi:hypothetical protein